MVNSTRFERRKVENGLHYPGLLIYIWCVRILCWSRDIRRTYWENYLGRVLAQVILFKNHLFRWFFFKPHATKRSLMNSDWYELFIILLTPVFIYHVIASMNY